MPRNLGAAWIAAAQAKIVCPALLVNININNENVHVWSGIGNYVWNGNTYTGVGDLGQITLAQETTEIQATGSSLTLSGCNPVDVNDALSDTQLGGPATIYLALLDPTTLVMQGSPTVLFSGLVDAPTVFIDADNGDDGTPATAMITIPIESRLAALGSGQQRKYSMADQARSYPTDSAFDRVSLSQYLAELWG
jgi:hypothetical protein